VYSKGVRRCFWVEIASKLGVFCQKKSIALIFRPPQWWPKFELADNTLSALPSDVSSA